MNIATPDSALTHHMRSGALRTTFTVSTAATSRFVVTVK
jgi:hypothetical protein